MAATSRTLPKKPTISDLRRFDGTLYAKNMTGNGVSANSSDIQFSLEPTGNDGSIKVLPRQVLDIAGFVKMWSRGLIEIGDDLGDEAIADADRRDSLHTARMAEIAGMTEENSTDRDLVERKCVISGKTVYQSMQEIRDLVPPLADEHKKRAHEFTPTQVQNPETGEIEVRFNRVQIG